MIQELRELYAYHRWANRLVPDSAAALSAEDLTRDLGSSFPSVLDTRAHILGAEWVWLSRWCGTSRPSRRSGRGGRRSSGSRRRWQARPPVHSNDPRRDPALHSRGLIQSERKKTTMISKTRSTRRHPALLLALTLAACGSTDREEARPHTAEATDSVTVVFTRDEKPAPVTRPVEQGKADLPTALSWLVRGPTEVERAAGIRSWFSEETAHVLRSATVDEHGHATVDFDDLRPYIGNAGTSTGSTLLLMELNGTVFQFPEIQSVEYRMEGSCDLFGEWIQYGCQRFWR